MVDKPPSLIELSIGMSPARNAPARGAQGCVRHTSSLFVDMTAEGRTRLTVFRELKQMLTDRDVAFIRSRVDIAARCLGYKVNCGNLP